MRSLPPLRNLAAFAAIVVFLPGCAVLFKKPSRAGAAAAAAPPPGPRMVGTVAVVNDSMHFVLLDVGSLYTPAAGTALKTFSGDNETGILTVGQERKRPFVAADIIEGTPQVGDRVEE